MTMTPPELHDSARAALVELDELIRTETVRTRHIQLVRLRGRVELVASSLAPLDNVINQGSSPAYGE